jgi:predicted DNA-binding transcriptional regulator AlpA
MHIDRLEKAGRFAKRAYLGPNTMGWWEDELLELLEQAAAAEKPSYYKGRPRRSANQQSATP